MYNIFYVAKKTINQYLQVIQNYFNREEKNNKKSLPSFFSRSCVLINTIDYIKETLGGISDLVVTLVEPQFSEKIDLTSEEELALSIIKNIVSCIKKPADIAIESIISGYMNKVNWDNLNAGITSSSPYIGEIKEKLSEVVDTIRGNVGDVYFIQILNSLCQATNSHFTNSIFKMKKISEMGNQQLVCGN